jgi:hypothetical protein
VLERAVRWIRRHALAGGGIVVSSRQRVSYPEVTGYFIPTLLGVGERDLARQFADWLVSVQRADRSSSRASPTRSRRRAGRRPSTSAIYARQRVSGSARSMERAPYSARPL